MDAHGAGLARAVGGRRFVSDPLRFTGVDLGNRSIGSTQRKTHRLQADGDKEISADEEENDSGISAEERERSLLESAWAQIRWAKENGNADVNMTVAELKALERQKKRMQMEEKRKRKEAEQRRVCIPLSDLDLPDPGDTLSVHPVLNQVRTSERGNQQRAGYPLMGHFPPPTGTGFRPRPETTSSTPASRSSLNLDRERRDSSPFSYDHVQPHPPTVRHVSDTSYPLSHFHEDHFPGDGWAGQAYDHPAASASATSLPASARQRVDPYQFMVSGPQPPYRPSAMPARRHVSGPPGQPSALMYGAAPIVYGAVPAAVEREASTVRARRHSESDDSGETTTGDEDATESGGSIELGEAAQTTRSSSGGVGSRGRTYAERIVVEESPEPELHPRPAMPEQFTSGPSKKSSRASSPIKRKAVASGSRRRKAK